MPPKLTAVAPVKLVPVIVTTVPMSADVGIKEVIVGCGIAKVKPETVAVPPGVVTLTFPLVAPVPTIAIICVELTDVGLAITPPIVTEYAEAVKLVPVIVIGVPCPPVLGLKPLMVGSRAKVKPEAVAVPPGVVILTTPLAPVPTTAVICVDEPAWKLCTLMPPKLTIVAPVRFVPVIVTVFPCPAMTGANEVIVCSCHSGARKDGNYYRDEPYWCDYS